MRSSYSEEDGVLSKWQKLLVNDLNSDLTSDLSAISSEADSSASAPWELTSDSEFMAHFRALHDQPVLMAATEPAPEPQPVVLNAENDTFFSCFSEPGIAAESGLHASFYAIDSSKKITSLSEIDFSVAPDATGMVSSLAYKRGDDPFWEGGPNHKFAARFEGHLNVAKAGEYTLYLRSDDGSMLYIDGKPVINHDGLHSATEKTVSLNLAAGSHEIEVRYYEDRGWQTLMLDWAGPDTNDARTTIDGESFSLLPIDIVADETIAEEPVAEKPVVEDPPADETPAEDPVTEHPHSDEPAPEEPVAEDPAPEEPDMSDPTGDHTGGDHTGGDHTGGDLPDGHDHQPDPVPDQPTTPEEEHAFVIAVTSEPDHAAHGDDASKALEHGQLLDLVPRSEATHVAVRDGDWFDADTWYQGRIPDADAKVLIPKGVSVDYNGESDASLFTVRVDGELSFATDTDTKMVVDTFVVSDSGRLEIGTEDNPVQDGVEAQIVIANNGDIDVNWDPTLLSRGVISHGQVEIHGAEKTAYATVADAPMAGDTEIRLSEIPDNWSVGDTIVLTGTHKTGWYWDRATGKKAHAESQDEEVVITAIDGGKISIDRALQYDHDAPRADLAAYVANMSRNVTFSSEDGDASAIHHRGHVMFMHNNDVDVRYAGFDDLGRTDKSEPAFKVENLDTVTSDSNIQTRYSFHFHKTGTADQDNPAIAFGNVVNGSPGWGYVHHSSHAEFVQNVSFDVFGAGFVAEDGDETGLWWENIAIKSEGIGFGHAKTKNGDDIARDDIGRTGDGFFFSGRAVETGHNVAANTTHGFVWMSRAASERPTVDQLDHPDAHYGREVPRSNNQVPIQGFHDNEAFGTEVGLIVVKGTPRQGHDVRTILDKFTNWETSDGVQLTYTAHYTLKDFDILGTTSTETFGAKTGFEFGNMSFDLAVNGIKIEGFKTAVDLEQRIDSTWADSDISHILIDAELTNNTVDLQGFDPDRHILTTSDQLVQGRLDFQMTGDTTIKINEDILLDGIKTDSVGSRDRQFTPDIQQLDFGKNILPILQKDGFYETKSGEYVMLINDLVADRATGELLKFSHVITLDASIDSLTSLGAVNNGLIDLNSAAPVTADDFVSTTMETGIIIDVLANDSDPENGVLKIDDFTNPLHGDLSLRDDGTLLFEPHENKVGVDSFDYWAADQDGVLSKATVYVEIFDL